LFATNAIAQTGTPSDFNAGLVPVAPNGPELVGWRTVPSPAQISEVFPADATYSGYTLWECQILVDGRLSDCALQTQWPPNDERYKVAAEKLLPIFRIDSHAIELAAREHKRVLFDLPVYREGSKTFPPGECPPAILRARAAAAADQASYQGNRETDVCRTRFDRQFSVALG